MEYNSTALDWFSTKSNKQNWYPAHSREKNAYILNTECFISKMFKMK